MAQNTSLEGLRSQVLNSIKGRKLGLDHSSYLVGAVPRVPVEGVTSGTTLISTASETIPAYGVSLIGSTGTSASTALSLAAPVPGVVKHIYNVSTGTATVTCASGTISSSGSVGSTQTILTFAGKGANVTLTGLTTGLWGLMGVSISSVSTMVTIA